jgi:ribosomal protein S7
MHKGLKDQGIKNPVKVLPFVVNSLLLPLETKTRRRGRNYLNIPFPVSSKRQVGIVLHKLLKVAKSSKTQQTFGGSLAFHLVQTLRGTGALVQDRVEVLRTLKSGRPFVHMRWHLFFNFEYHVYFESIGSFFP